MTKSAIDKFSVAAVNLAFCQGYLIGVQEADDLWFSYETHIFSPTIRSANEEELILFMEATSEDPVNRINWDEVRVKESTEYYSNGTFDEVGGNEGWNFLIDIPDVDGNIWKFAHEVEDGSFAGVLEDLTLYPTDVESIKVSHELYLDRQDEKNYKQIEFMSKWDWTSAGFPDLTLYNNWNGIKGETHRGKERREMGRASSVEARFKAMQLDKS